MKGVVFTELFSFVEDGHSPEFLQETIDDSKVPSKGVYTATGTYPVCEMASLVATLSKKTGAEVPDLLRVFGEHLFHRFHDGHPSMFEGVDNAFDFLVSVEDHIHVEVKKLYPDAELPRLDVAEHTPNRFRLIYTSSRHLGDFCEGLIRGCLAHFKETAVITRKDLESDPNAVIEFTIEKTHS